MRGSVITTILLELILISFDSGEFGEVQKPRHSKTKQILP